MSARELDVRHSWVGAGVANRSSPMGAEHVPCEPPMRCSAAGMARTAELFLDRAKLLKTPVAAARAHEFALVAQWRNCRLRTGAVASIGRRIGLSMHHSQRSAADALAVASIAQLVRA